MNALSQELLFEFNEALHDYEADDSVRVIIIKGAGRCFSAGYDPTPPQGRGADAVVRRHRAVDDQGRRLLWNMRTGMQQITDIQMYYCASALGDGRIPKSREYLDLSVGLLC